MIKGIDDTLELYDVEGYGGNQNNSKIPQALKQKVVDSFKNKPGIGTSYNLKTFKFKYGGLEFEVTPKIPVKAKLQGGKLSTGTSWGPFDATIAYDFNVPYKTFKGGIKAAGDLLERITTPRNPWKFFN